MGDIATGDAGDDGGLLFANGLTIRRTVIWAPYSGPSQHGDIDVNNSADGLWRPIQFTY